MSFPINPTDGQKTTQNNIIYVYSTATNSWKRSFNNLIDRLVLSGYYGSDNATTGTLVVYGGVGIGENLNVDGNLQVNGEVNLSPIGSDVNILPSVGGTVNIFPAQAGDIDNMIIGGTIPKVGYFTDTIVVGTSNASSTNTGALQVVGGAGIAKDLYVGGTIYQNGIPINNDNATWITIFTDYLASSNEYIFISTTGTSSVVITLPEVPKIGDQVTFVDLYGTFGTNNLIFDRNGNRIMGLEEDLTIDIDHAANSLIFSGELNGWKIGAVF